MADNPPSTSQAIAIPVAAGLVFHLGRLLITQRKPGHHLGGYWEFPGGKREREETLDTCLKRELDEELGIQVEVGSLLRRVTHQYPEKCVELFFYRCQWRSGEVRRLGVNDFAWVTASELSAYQFPEADEQLISILQTDAALWIS